MLKFPFLIKIVKSSWLSISPALDFTFPIVFSNYLCPWNSFNRLLSFSFSLFLQLRIYLMRSEDTVGAVLGKSEREKKEKKERENLTTLLHTCWFIRSASHTAACR